MPECRENPLVGVCALLHTLFTAHRLCQLDGTLRDRREADEKETERRWRGKSID